MLRIILGILAGYAAFSVFLFVALSVLYMVLGTSGSFQAGNYDLKSAWLVSSVIIFLLAGIIAALVCGLIDKNLKSSLHIGAVILLLGILIAVSQIAQDPGITPRVIEEVPLMEAMEKAHGPIWSYFLNPIAGFIGALIGGMFIKTDLE